ncbi:uracil-DNA glycosylase [Burkholderiaceae bacterium DAT-1]|nr:uracil-DNA glycosylase [Burkholderiaceae bacterium DAT-1]
MNRLGLIMEELDLLPMWVRRDVLDEWESVEQAEHAALVASHPAREALTSMHTPMAPHAMPEAPKHSHHLKDTLSVMQPASAPQAIEVVARKVVDAQIATMDWSALEAAVRECTACDLCKTRTQTVFAAGVATADWMVVGEAPGADEDRLGEPFVGRAGKLLDAMLASVGHSRADNVCIANVLKCRPPRNRNPEPDEMARCQGYLLRQIELVKPKIIFAVGRFAVQTLLGSEASIASLRGRVHQYKSIPVIVSYHPAYLLRNPTDKIKAWEDLLLAKKTLAAALPAGG